jgi:hypothetical protein
MTKHTPFEMAVDRMQRLTNEEKIALMKLISAQLGGPRFYTGDEMQTAMMEAVRMFADDLTKRQQIATIDARRVN